MTTITIEYDKTNFLGEPERRYANVECHSISIWRKHPKELFVAGTLELIGNVKTWIEAKATRIRYEKDTLQPCPEGYRLCGSRQIARGRHIAMFRSLDSWCVWDASDDALYRKLKELFTTPLLPEWIPDARQTMNQWVRPLYGHNQAGLRIDSGLTQDALDQHICRLVKRKLLKI